MGKNSKDWKKVVSFGTYGMDSTDWKETVTLGTYGWDSEDFVQAGMVVGGIALGALTGGVAAGAMAGGLGAAAGATIGGAVGLGAGGLKAYESQVAEDTAQESKKAIRKQEAEARENEIMRKQSLLSAATTMTAREAMARNINAAIRNMYRPKTAGNNPSPGVLGGEEQKLG